MLKLSKTQQEILQVLAEGAMLVLDQHNMLNLPTALPGRNGNFLQPITRTFLIKNRLIERFDKTRDVRVKGNGYVISGKGRKLLSETK